MSILANVGSFLWGTLQIFPIIGFVLAYILVLLWKKDKRTAVRWAVNITNFLLIQAVTVAYDLIWPEALSAWWWVLFLFVALVLLLGWMQVRLRGRISLRRVGFSAWRISFLVFCLAYLFLFVTGVWKTMQLS